MPRVAILGGGIAGLAAAFRLRELTQDTPAVSFRLYEATARTGGSIVTVRTGGALLELGADSLLVNKPAMARLLDRLHLTDEIVDQQAAYRGARVLFKNNLRRLPPEFRLFAPRSVAAIANSGLFSPLGMVRAALEPFVPARESTGDESLASFVTRRLGREVLDRLAQPLVGGIYSADPSRLSMQIAMPEFVRYEREYGSLLRAMRHAPPVPPPRLASLRGGLQRLVDALHERVNDTVVTSAAVRGIERTQAGWVIDTAGGVEHAEAVICALPANVAGRVIRGATDVAGAIAAIRSTRIATVNLLYDAGSIELPQSTGFVVPACERRSITAATFSSQKYPDRVQADTVAVRAFVGGALAEHLLDAGDDEIALLAQRELAAILNTSARPRLGLVQRWDNVPQYDVGHERTLAQLHESAARLPGLVFAGCAMRGVGIPDCIMSAEAAAESVFGYVVRAKGAHT